MARTSQPLQAKEPKRDRTIPDEIWQIPRLVAEVGQALGLDQGKLAKAAGLSQSKISQLLAYNNLKAIRVITVLRLEKALRFEHGALTKRAVIPFRANADTPQPPSAVRQSEPVSA
jgi:DNA-binding Xre family transcriptional regulator